MAFVQRTGQDTILRSEKLPAIEIQIDPGFRYAGSTSFILYEIARVEQHHFVLADTERRVVRQLWFQFEGYLDNNDYTYDVSLEPLRLQGFTFQHNTYLINIEQTCEARPTSDYAHVVDFLRDKGYLLTGDMIAHRMFWLDPDLRNELMIIYWEVLAPAGYRLSDLAEGGLAADQWQSLSQTLQKRSLSSFTIL